MKLSKFKPKPLHFLDKGKCRIDVDSNGKPGIWRKRRKIPFQEWSKWATKKFFFWLDQNKTYFDHFKAKYVNNLLDNEIVNLDTMFNRCIKEGDEINIADNEEEEIMIDNMNEEPWIQHYKNMDIKGLPITKGEAIIIKKAREKALSTIKYINLYRKLWRRKFSFVEGGNDSWTDKDLETEPIKETSKAKEYEDEKSTIEIARQITERGPEPVYNKWSDGSEYKLKRTPMPDEYFNSGIPRINRAREPTTKLKILYTNVPRDKTRSVCDVFWDVVTEFQPDIWFMSELFFDASKSSYMPKNYEFYTHKKLREKHTGILVKKSLEATFKLEKSKFNETELTMKTTRGKTSHFLVLYRSPTNDASVYTELGYDLNDEPAKRHLEWLNKRISKFLAQPEPALVIGDLNVDMDRRSSRIGDKFARENWIELFGQYQDVFEDQTTYVSREGTGSHIDYALTNLKERIKPKIIHHIESENWTDHVMFEFKWPIEIKKQRSREYSLIKKKLKMNEDERNAITMAKIEENVIARWPEARNTQDKVSIMEEETFKLLPVERKMMPTRQESIAKDPEVMAAKRERLQIVMEENLQGFGKLYSAKNHRLKASNYKITKKKKMALRNSFMTQIYKKGAKADQWALFNAFKAGKNKLPNFISPNSTAKFFSQLSFNYQDQKRKMPTVREEVDKFEFKVLERMDEETGMLKNLKKLIFDGRGSKHSYAKDGLTFMSVRQYSDRMLELVKEVINETFQTGQYPKSFRQTTLNIVPKKPVIEKHKDCRPVTVTPQNAMLQEKCITKQITHEAENKDWLHENMFGFRPKRSIGQLLNKLRKSIARLGTKKRKKYHCILLTDLSNAFGSTDIEIILDELKDNLSPRASAVIKAFLSPCTSQVKIETEFSKPFHNAPRGYPQGACISPLMFCLIMRYMHSRVNFVGYSFADDATFLITGNTIEEMKENIYQCLGEFDDFCKSLNIKLNIGKTLYIYKDELNLEFRGEKLIRESSSRVLGVRIDSDVTNTAQIEYLLSQLNLTRVMINGYSSHCDKRMVRLLVNSHALGKVGHACAYFDLYPSGDYIQLQQKVNKMLRNKMTRSIMVDFYRCHGLLDRTTNENLVFEATGKRLIDLDIEDMLNYQRHISQIEGTGPERQKIEKRLQNLYKQAETARNRNMSAVERKIIIRELKKRDRLRTNLPQYNHIELPQWMIMKTAKCMSVQNFIRKSHMNRLGSILLRGRPTFELEEILEYATERFYNEQGRITIDYPYFKNCLRKDIESNKSIIKRCAPEIWFNEYRELPMSLRKCLKEGTFMNSIKKYYNNRCQHKENSKTACEQCNKPHNCYRLNYYQERAREIIETAQDTQFPVQISDNTLTEHEILEIRRESDGHIAYQMTERSFAILNERLNGILANR